MTCGMERIKRNATYYTTGSNQNIWCEKCFAKFKESESITLDDGTETSSSRLHQAKNDANPEETWVRCDGCHANVHQICALTGDRIRNPDEKWFCPKCDLRNREDSFLPPSKFERRADDLQRCDMSDFMEEGLRKILEKAYELKSKEMQIPLEEIEKAHGLAIRVLSHITKKHAVRDEVRLRPVSLRFCMWNSQLTLNHLKMFELYSKVGCPSYFPAHTKCIGLFQKIDGIDVLLFVMYVYEYGHDCPAPNRRRVYISYLDSVQYFQPSTFRTLAYQSVIIQYLRFVKKRGFHTAHIWSCPPTPGDEYVFYCHPVSQRIPQEDKLRGWYVDLLEKAKDEGIVVETTNFYEEYFADSNAPCVSAVSPMSLPYFEGDYIPGEIENILSHLSKEEKRNLPVAKAIPRRSGSKLGTRSNPGNLVSHTQDKIMERLGKAIYNIKENLMIARLRTKAFVTAIERDDDVARWPDNDDELLPLIKGTDSCVSTNKQIDILSDGEYENFNADVDDANRPVTRKEISRAFANTSGPMVGTSEDKDPQFESELFENRQLFLNYCQMNNCQFDDLRKAKHTTMMVLYQLHTPAAPKFFQQCGSCQRDIVHGNRYHCNICSSFDLCDACYKVVSTGARSSGGQANRHDASHSFTKISLRDYAEARRSAEERQKSLQGYLGVLVHAANCLGPPGCKLNNCEKMKKLFVHVRTCDLTYIKGCKVCHRLVSLIIVHARSCDVRGSCSLPFCDKIRERNERMRRQQQLMDDRRREAQNSYYNAGDGP
jgi:E1A/CREB-binding protein